MSTVTAQKCARPVVGSSVLSEPRSLVKALSPPNHVTAPKATTIMANASPALIAADLKSDLFWGAFRFLFLRRHPTPATQKNISAKRLIRPPRELVIFTGNLIRPTA